MNQLGSGSGRCGYLLAYVQEFHFSMHYTQINDYLSRITDTACQTLSLSNDDMEFMDESSDYRRCRNDSCSWNQDAKVIRLAMASNVSHELFGLIFQRLMQLEWQFWMAVNHSEWQFRMAVNEWQFWMAVKFAANLFLHICRIWRG